MRLVPINNELPSFPSEMMYSPTRCTLPSASVRFVYFDDSKTQPAPGRQFFGE
jgi:hypothetical protein